ncbi:MAG: mannose-1-phosphate guanylyltransferase [Candidatus Neomarinimicrobiota bacterium]|nr:MAG: mannose-1-phosphate guanylyltransferase [Candidatus Neomarinimicrobiota bacterium]
MEHYYSVILAGGVGKRFWPLSKRKHPKQLLDIVGNKSMVNLTIDRLNIVSDLDHIFIMTNKEQAKMIMAQNDALTEDNFIIEPSGKNTAPAIGLAAMYLLKKDPEAVMGLFPADHLITDLDKFSDTVKVAIEATKTTNSLFTFGIKPTYPATGYGYIQVDKDVEYTGSVVPENIQIFNSKTFAEKPDSNTAKLFLKSGEFFWNSGMFIWKAQVIIDKINRFLPEIGRVLQEIGDIIGTPQYDRQINKKWKTITPISIDYGVLEQSSRINVVIADFDWNDVGSWDTVYKIEDKDKNKNVIHSKGMMLHSSGNYIYSKNLKIFGLGVKNLVIVENEGALLILPRSEAENIKEIVDSLPFIGEEELL